MAVAVVVIPACDGGDGRDPTTTTASTTASSTTTTAATTAVTTRSNRAQATPATSAKLDVAVPPQPEAIVVDVRDVRNPSKAGVGVVVLVDGAEVGRAALFPPDQPGAFRYPLTTSARRVAVEVRIESTASDVATTVAVEIRGRAG